MNRKILSSIIAFSMALTFLSGVSTTAQAASLPKQSNNIGEQDYTLHGSSVNSYLVENYDGTIERIEYIEGYGLLVEDYGEKYQLIESRTIQIELPIFGGFFAGEDYFFILCGQENAGEKDNKEVIRVVKYSKDWE